jgi:adenosine deaminase
MSAFTDALEAGDLDAVRACPKADLHNHGPLCGHRSFLREHTGVDIAPLTAPLRSMDEMHRWFAAKIAPAFATYDKRAAWLLGWEAAFLQALADGVTRIEFGDDVWAITQGLGGAAEMRDSLSNLHARVAPQVEWIPVLGMSRHCSIEALDRWLSPFLELGLTGSFDLSGDELAQPIEVFAPLYAKAKAAGLRLKAHVGEWGTADDVRRAVELLELDEVQHGIAAADDPAVMRFLADNRIRLNICPTSNVMLGRVENLAAHPIRKLFHAGVVVTVNTDDVLFFGNGVSEEFLALHRAGVLTAHELDEIRTNGLDDMRGTGQAGPDRNGEQSKKP